MRRSLILLPALLAFFFTLAACNHIDVTDDEDAAEATDPATPQPGSDEGDEDILSVADILSGQYADQEVWATGYIVGYVNGNSLSQAVFGLPSAPNTNFLLADSPDVTDAASVTPVELPKGTKRDALNLYDHPELLGCKVIVVAVVEQYFRVPGLKRLYDYSILDEEGEGGGNTGGSSVIIPIDHEAIVLDGR